MVPLLLELRVMLPEPLSVLERVRGELATPLFRRTRLFAPKVQVPVLTTGVAVSAAKLTPLPDNVFTKLLGSVIVAPPEARSGAKPGTGGVAVDWAAMVIAPLPKDEALLK